MMRKILSVLACVLVPAVAEAAVYVNEIAWMGGADDANAEWIELLNSGASSVDLSGWTLVASDGSPTITLSGSIAGGGLYLLERTDDDSVAATPERRHADGGTQEHTPGVVSSPRGNRPRLLAAGLAVIPGPVRDRGLRCPRRSAATIDHDTATV